MEATGGYRGQWDDSLMTLWKPPGILKLPGMSASPTPSSLAWDRSEQSEYNSSSVLRTEMCV